jgi:Putative zinc-finger
MASFLDIILGVSHKHVRDEQLVALMDGELSLAQTHRIQRHLEQCWNCRARHGRLQTVIHGFVDYSNEVVKPFLPPPPSRRDRFIAAVDAELEKDSSPWHFSPVRMFHRISEQAMNPALITVFVVVLAAALLVAVWRRAPKHRLTPEQLLSQSMRSEQLAQQQAGVEYRKVEIRTTHSMLERAIYRDLTNRRKVMRPKLTQTDGAIKNRLESAGIDWQNPLSSADFEAWRNHVRVIKDQVKRTAPGQWTLSTDTDDSTVRQASLTVREADFHPISRQVVFRDSEEVTIAELNYDVLPWSTVNEGLFEPLHEATSGVVSATRASLHAALPTRAELGTAELEAQLALVKIHADDGEDVRVEPGAIAVYVRGVVDTDRRKREIEAELNHVALVKTELQSVEQIERQRGSSPSKGPVQVRGEELRPSPLEKFLSDRSVPADQAVLLSRTLIGSSIVIDREARALATTDAQYGKDNAASLNEANQRLFSALQGEYIAMLLRTLANEEAVLTPYAAPGDFGIRPSGSLNELAVRNHQLCDELVAGTGNDARPAVDILHDLVRVSAQIRRILNTIQPPPRP